MKRIKNLSWGQAFACIGIFLVALVALFLKDPVGGLVMSAVAMVPFADRKRKLQSIVFAENQILSRDLPRDTVLKGLNLRLSGSVVTTFGSGTPVADALSTFDNIIPRIDVIINGSRTVKSVRPYLLRMQQLFTSQILAERKSSAAATAAAGNNPVADATFQYGSTTNLTTAAETIYLPFEMVYCDIGMGRESTWLNLKGVASAELRLTCAAFSTLLGFGNTAPVVYTSSTFSVEIITTEAQDVNPEIYFSDWKQTTKELTFSAQTTNYAIDINRGNRLAGIMLLARDGAAGSATTATGKLRSNLLVTNFSLKVNGQTDIQSNTFLSQQAMNRAQYGVNAPYASSVSLIDGVCHINLLARKDISTALDVSPPLVDQVQLFVDTNDSTTVSYTNPCSLTVQTEEIVSPR